MEAPPSLVRLSVVIPVRNGAPTLASQLDALSNAEAPNCSFEVVVADNGSTDDTASIAMSFSDRLSIRVIDASHRTGANAARNDGVAAASGDWLAFCDADDEVDVHWLHEVGNAFEAGYRLFGGPIDYGRLNSEQTRAWRGNRGETVMRMHQFLPAAHGANMGITREVFDAIGGFDETFIHGGDDVELCWRAQLAGVELQEAQNAIVHYRLRPSMRAHWRQCASYGRSEVLLYRKFGPDGMPRRPLTVLIRETWWLVTRLPFAWPIERRGAWLRRLATQWGRISGALRFRTAWW